MWPGPAARRRPERAGGTASGVWDVALGVVLVVAASGYELHARLVGAAKGAGVVNVEGHSGGSELPTRLLGACGRWASGGIRVSSVVVDDEGGGGVACWLCDAEGPAESGGVVGDGATFRKRATVRVVVVGGASHLSTGPQLTVGQEALEASMSVRWHTRRDRCSCSSRQPGQYVVWVYCEAAALRLSIIPAHRNTTRLLVAL